jgi:GDP-mannose 6-dehydrogenase
MTVISVLGLGYVGCVSAACLAKQGHCVLGVDVNPAKVDVINQGRSPIVENGLDQIIAEAVAAGRLSAHTDAEAIVAQSDISLVCVGTPSQANGNLDLQYVRNVARQIGRALKRRDAYHAVVVRSTMLPGSMESVVVPILEEESGKQAGRDFGVHIYPEFIREGSAIEDYYHPGFILIGSLKHAKSAHLAYLEPLHTEIDAPIFNTDLPTAEMVKYASNAFHALKIGFANEIGTVCKALNIDSHSMMEIFMQDTRLNISAKYLRPGFAFGGSCLPKDLRALMYKVKTLDLETPLLKSIVPSNEEHIERAFQMIHGTGKKSVGILGLSFKAGTDDLRESPMVQLVERLLGKGYAIRIYDEDVSFAKIIGGNRHYIDQIIPHVSSLLVSGADEILAHAELLVVGKETLPIREILARTHEGQQIIDLVRISANGHPPSENYQGNYQGICW